MNREQIYDALFNLFTTNLGSVSVTNEPCTIPATPFRYTVAWASRFVSDISVVNSITGLPLTKVVGTPITGQYAVSATGVYTFASANVGLAVLISYNFTGVETASKRLLHWSDCNAAMQPAIFLVKHSEVSEKVRGFPSKWTLNFQLWVYVETSNDPNAVPATLMNPILDQIDRMFNVDNLPAYALTLGGLVSHVALQGQIQTDEGLLGPQAVAVLPIEVLVPT